MSPAAASVSVATLRNHVLVLSGTFADGGPAALKPLAAAYPHFLRSLARAAACPDLDGLADTLRGADELLASVEAIHARRAVAGIARIRAAFAGVEEFIDHVPLAAHGESPVPNALLDIPASGLLANLLQRRVASPAAKPVKAAPVRAARPLKKAA